MRALLKADGSAVHYTEPVSSREIDRLIGARITDVVRLRHLGPTPEHVMIVDDEGWDTEQRISSIGGGQLLELVPVKARKPVNELATRLYHAECVPGTEHQIVGDVFVCPDKDFGKP